MLGAGFWDEGLGIRVGEQVAVGPGFLKHHILYILCIG